MEQTVTNCNDCPFKQQFDSFHGDSIVYCCCPHWNKTTKDNTLSSDFTPITESPKWCPLKVESITIKLIN